MPQLVHTEITIDGKPVKQFRSFKLDQAIFEHHRFELVCPVEAIDGKAGSVFSTSGNWMGTTIYVRITPIPEGKSLVFSGVITQIEAARSGGLAGDIIISGCSPTIVLDSGPHCKSWERKVIKNIVLDVLRHFPANMLRPVITPGNNETLPYVVQYKETAWQFINRLAAGYGEWLYYTGQQLVMGHQQATPIHLVYGVHLSKLSMSVQAQPMQFQLLAYDYVHDEVYHGSSEQLVTTHAGLNALALEKSRLLFATHPKQWHNRFVTNKKQLADFMALQAAARSSSMFRCTGSSGVPGLHPGCRIHLQGRNVYLNSEEHYGDYTVVSVRHSCDGQGNYNNDFEVIPAAVKVPPMQRVTEPRCETQSALVTDNYDTKGMGRIRVKFHWMGGNEKSPWLRITMPYAGSNKGFFAIPEIGEEVMVAFEGDHPSKPYVIGSVYNGRAMNSFSTEKNELKVFQSRSGNKILLNDSDGSVSIEDKDGNRVKLDGAGSIQLDAKESLVLRCGDAVIEMKKDGAINLNGKEVAILGETLVDVKGDLITLN